MNDNRQKRLGEALRANLKRRKQQARERDQSRAGETEPDRAASVAPGHAAEDGSPEPPAADGKER